MSERQTLRRTLEDDGCVFFEHEGVRYFAAWDEDANGIYAWPDGCDENTSSDWYLGDDEVEAAETIAMRSAP